MYTKKRNLKKGLNEVYTIYKGRQVSLLKPINSSSRSFHGALKWILITAQCFGQIPVIGITKPDVKLFKFKWKSWRTFYCILNCTGAFFLTSTYVINVFVNGMDIFSSTSVAFHINTLAVTLLFLKLATQWPKLMYKWAEMEQSMKRYGWPPYLHIRLNVLTLIVLSIALVEYTIVKTNKFLISKKYKTNESIFEYYITITLYPHIFPYTKYAHWKGVILQIMNILLTFSWTFNDLFIMLISTGLAVRFQEITVRLRTLKSLKSTTIETWREIREDYNRLSQLTKTVDNALSYIILASFTNNLFFILAQLFNSLRPMKDTLEKVYFFFSFGFMIIRTVSVSIYGAWIYDESKEPTTILNSILSDTYNVEIKRFINQIKFDTVALSGKHFFYIRRGLILSMAGAIVTYELVLIQFNVNLLQEETSENGTITYS
ncbi:hypothetical protein RN001_007519 [Aquatica leii]|uniref:Gustatory receptor n=1 Tax=Aquatica leii TaxID=1421715 RepID=A0AAN7SNW8_9COLE|nr:hypothetical protein RN001_007519 [Aquatica leii]